MKDIIDLKSEADYQLRKADDLVALFEKEGRAPTDAEKKQIKEHQAEAARLMLEVEEIKEAERIAAEVRKQRDEFRKPVERKAQPMQPDNDGDHYVTAKKFELRSYVPYSLDCFKDRGQGSAKAAEDGYRFGVWLAAKFWGDGALWSKQRFRDLSNNERAMNEGVNTQGGALVADQYSAYLIKLVEEYGVWIKESRVVPMTSDHMIVPRQTSTLTTYNVGEGSATTESELALDNITLTAKKLGVLARYSSELSEDAVLSVADMLASEMARTAAQKIDEVGFDGDGSNADFGIQGLIPRLEALDSTYWAQTRIVPINTLAELTAAALGKIQGRVGLHSKPNGKFYCSPSAADVGIGGVLQGMGGVTIAEASGAVPMRYNGYPVVQSHYLREESSGSIADDDVMVIFGDLRNAATTGIRRQFEIAESKERYFLEDQIALRGILRFDINIHDLGGLESAGHTAKGPLCAFMADAA